MGPSALTYVHRVSSASAQSDTQRHLGKQPVALVKQAFFPCKAASTRVTAAIFAAGLHDRSKLV